MERLHFFVDLGIKKQEKELWSSWIRNFWDGRGNVSLEFPPSDPTWILLRDPLGISSVSPHIPTGEEFPGNFPGNPLRAEFGAIESQDFTARAKGKGEKLEIRDAPDGNSQILSQRGIFSLNYGKSPLHSPLCMGKGRKSGNPKAGIPKFPDFQFSGESRNIFPQKEFPQHNLCRDSLGNPSAADRGGSWSSFPLFHGISKQESPLFH